MSRSFLSRSLIGTCNPQTAPLQGLRVLSCFIVVIGHAYCFAPLLLDSPIELQQILTSKGFLTTQFYHLFSSAMMLSVDTFLFISGFLFASTIYSRSIKESGRISFPTAVQYIISRWLRLVPLHALIFFMFKAAGMPTCSNYAELSMLRVLNGSDMCVSMAWSTSVDFQTQLYVMMILTYLPSLAKVEQIMWMLTFASGIFRVQKWFDTDLPSIPSFFSALDMVSTRVEFVDKVRSLGVPISNFDPTLPEQVARYLERINYSPLYYFANYRAGSMFIGIAVWFSMKHNTLFTRIVRAYPLYSFTFSILTFFFYNAGTAGYFHTLFFRTIYEGFGRLLFVVGIGIFTVLTCSIDKTEWWGSRKWLIYIRKFFGSRLFVMLARSTYVVYMIQLLTMRVMFAEYPTIRRESFESISIGLAGIKWYLFTLLISIPFCMFEEGGLIFRKRLLRSVFYGRCRSKSE